MNTLQLDTYNMKYLYKESSKIYFVSLESGEGVLAEFEDNVSNFMDLSLDVISSLGVVSSFILENRTIIVEEEGE